MHYTTDRQTKANPAKRLPVNASKIRIHDGQNILPPLGLDSTRSAAVNVGVLATCFIHLFITLPHRIMYEPPSHDVSDPPAERPGVGRVDARHLGSARGVHLDVVAHVDVDSRV